MATDISAPDTDLAGIPVEAWREVRSQLVAFVERRVRDRDTAEDIAQSVLERLTRSSASGIDNPRAWLYRAARNAIIDHYRTRRSTSPLDETIGDVRGFDGPLVEPGLGDPSRELAACLIPLVDQLPEPYRRAVSLVDLDGMTHAAAARVEFVSVSGMKSRVQRGRTKLVAMLTACCDVTLNADRSVDDYRAPAGCDCTASA